MTEEEPPYGSHLKVGDIVTAYKPGYHRILQLEDRRPTYSSLLVHYKPLINGKGGKARNEECCCDAAYCRPAGERIKEQLEELEQHIASLKEFQKEHDL